MNTVWVLCVVFTCLTPVTGQGIVIQNIRLANGPNATSGRLEIQVEGLWGTVCDDQWDNLDAAVACKHLGYTGGGSATTNAFFGQGTGTIYIDDTACDGSETRLDACRMTTSSDCTHVEDAGVVCVPNTGNPVTGTTTTTPTPTVAPVPDNCATGTNLNVRLVARNITRGVGYVEVRNGPGGTWGSVCDDSFNENAARVVCRTLCFDPLIARAGAPAWAIGQPRLPIILDDVRCNGNEASIQDCSHRQWNEHNCGENEVANVDCVLLESYTPQPPSPLLECYQGFLVAVFNKSRDRNLEQKHLTISNPYTGACNITFVESNDTITMRIPFQTCGTNLTYNSTHLIYTNVVKYDQTSVIGSISRVNTYLVELSCEMPRDPQVTKPFDPQTQMVTQKATGEFVVTMTFYRNNSFSDPVTQTPLRLPIGEWLNVALQLESIDTRLKLVVPDCVATPDGNMNNAINYPLFTNSCRNEATLNFIDFSQTRFGYRYQPFMFVNYAQVYLHCGAFVCVMEEDSAQCDRSCNSSKPSTTSRRKREASSPKEMIYVHGGPLMVYKLDNSMTILERVGEPQTYSTTFKMPVETSTPTPATSTLTVGTSVKVIQTSTTEAPSSTRRPSETTPVVETSASQEYTTSSSSKGSTKQTVTTTVPSTKKNLTSQESDVTTTLKTTTSESSTPQGNKPEDGFMIERGESTKDELPPSAGRVSNVLQGYVPNLISSSIPLTPSCLTLISYIFSIVYFL